MVMNVLKSFADYKFTLSPLVATMIRDIKYSLHCWLVGIIMLTNSMNLQ